MPPNTVLRSLLGLEPEPTPTVRSRIPRRLRPPPSLTPPPQPTFQGFTALEQAVMDIPGDFQGRVMDLIQNPFMAAPITPAVQQALTEFELPQPQPGGGGFVAPPTTPPAPSGFQPPDVKWKVGTYTAPGGNVPDWWQPLVPASADDYNRPDASFTMMMNAMIPYLSPEDQVTVANQLYTMWGNDFSGYKPSAIGAAPTTLSPEQVAIGLQGETADVQYFRGPQRAQQAIEALNNLRASTVGGNRWKLGPGYKWLQTVLGAVGGIGGTTRAAQVARMGALDPLLGQTQAAGDLAPFGPIGRMLTNPFFSRFQLNPVTRLQSGAFQFGAASPLLQF